MRHQLELEDADFKYLEKLFGEETIKKFLKINIDNDKNLDTEMDKVLTVAVAMELSRTKYWLNPDKRIAAYTELMRQEYENRTWILSDEDFQEGLELLLCRKLEEWELLYLERRHLIEVANEAYFRLFSKKETTTSS